MVGEVRGVGLLAALEFVADKKTKQRFDGSKKIGPAVSAACLDEGLIARAMPQGDILGLAPPLVITRDEIDALVTMAKHAVDKVYAGL
jgi:L-2,4-diaminobutyrate transaminase